jgi:hypothetical protein
MVEEQEETDANSFALLSPPASASKHGVFEIFPSLRFDSSTSIEIDGLTSDTTLSKVLHLEHRLKSFKEKLTQPFTDIEASYFALIQDVSKVNDWVKNLHSNIRKRLPISGKSLPSVWSFLGLISTNLESCQQDSAVFHHAHSLLADDLNHTHEELAVLQEVVTSLDDWKNGVDAMMDIFHKRFQHIKPFISTLSRSSTASRVIPSRVHDSTDALVQCIALLEQKLETLQNFEADSMQCQFSDLEDKVKLLENRVVGAGVQMGGMDFQSFEDLLAWVQIKLP